MADCTAGLRKHGNLDQAREIAQLQALEQTYAEFKEEHDPPPKRFFRDFRGGWRACAGRNRVIANVTRQALEHCDPVGNPVDGPVASGWRQSPTAVSMSAPVDTRIRVLHSTCCCVGPPVHQACPVHDRSVRRGVPLLPRSTHLARRRRTSRLLQFALGLLSTRLQLRFEITDRSLSDGRIANARDDSIRESARFMRWVANITAASGAHRARCVLSHIIPDDRSPTPAGATNRNDSWRSCARCSDAEGARPRFSRRRVHRSLRRRYRCSTSTARFETPTAPSGTPTALTAPLTCSAGSNVWDATRR